MRQITTIISTFLTSLILMGTSLKSLGFDGVYSKLDSNKAFLVDGEIASNRISTPTISMYRRADREIAINMNEEIKAASKKKITSGSADQADIEINNHFFNQFNINTFQVPSEQENELVCLLFYAENIPFSIGFSMKAADEIIHGQFMDQQQL